MNIVRCRCFFLLFALALVVGCAKKNDRIAEDAEAALPPEEQMPTATSSGKSPLENGKSDDSPELSVPADLLALDNAYEAWFKKYNLDLNDPKMLDADPDGDGASNRDEFLANTNPRDPNSRPGEHAFIRLKEYHEIKVPLLLESVEGETARVKHVGEGETKTETVRAGQTVGGMKVVRVIERHETDKNGEPVDVSRVELDDPSTKEHVLLVKDMPAKSATSYAVLTSPDRQTTITVKQGDVFQWPGNPGGSYKVLDLRPDQAVVQQIETKKMFTIPRQ